MITCFPKPYPDEIFYSVCARYSDRMKYTSKIAVMRDLYGKQRLLPVVDLPACFDALIGNLPPNHRYTADRLIDNHTLFLFYASFLSLEQQYRLRKDMHKGSQRGLHFRIGIPAYPIPLPNYLRFCPLCTEDDNERFGEYYWHRVHQAPGVLVCPVHHVFIQNSNVLARNITGPELFVSAQKGIAITPMTVLDPLNLSHTILLEIACDIFWLLNQPKLELDSKSRYQRYLHALKQHDLLTFHGLVRMKELQQSFENHYPSDLLSLLHCKLEKDVEENWLVRLLRPTSSSYNQHPLQHILLIRFLGYSADTFFSDSPDKKDIPKVSDDFPFGEGPWPCLNTASDHYQQRLVKTCQISYNHRREKRPIGTFSCECGFIYTRTGRDSATEDRYSIGRIKAVGAVWESKLRMLWKDSELSLDQIALQLGVTRSTVKDHAGRLELPRRMSNVRGREPQWIQIPKRAPRVQIEDLKLAKRDSYRKVWLSAIGEEQRFGSNLSKREVRKLSRWLSNNDKEWLKEHPRKISKRQLPTRVDWQNRDRLIADEVETEAFRLRNLPGRPVHISMRQISQNIGRTSLIPKHLDKLPLASEALARVVESHEQWSVHRVWWAADLERQEQLRPSRWRLIRRAHVLYYRNVPTVKEALDAAMQTLVSEEAMRASTNQTQ